MEWASVLKVVDLGITALLVITLIYALLRSYPRYLKNRIDERGQIIDLARSFAERLVAAQEKQADATAKLAECQARSEAAMSESFDSLQMSISSVDQRAAGQAQHIAVIESELREIRRTMNVINLIDHKLDRLLPKE